MTIRTIMSCVLAVILGPWLVTPGSAADQPPPKPKTSNTTGVQLPTVNAAPPATRTLEPLPTLNPPPGAFTPRLKPGPQEVIAAPATIRLRGWVDMHTHPMVHLAFGGKLVHGAPDIGSLIPADANCNQRVRATSMEHALGHDNSTHGGWGAFDNTCGDDIRKQVIDNLQSTSDAIVTPDSSRGASDFATWPAWNDVTHQKMYVDWLRRAYDSGLRVMVALATNNQTLAAAVSGPGDGPTDDKASGDLQLDEMRAFVGRHRDFMEIAYSAADLRRIVLANKLAIVLGVELDNIGNFNKVSRLTQPMIAAEIRRLYDKGVRYIFPVHVIDNKFGGTAIYKDLFNTSNYREFGSFWSIGCAAPGDRINKRFNVDGFDFAVAFVKAIKLGIDIARQPPTPPACAGHVNTRGLQPEGVIAVKEMMKLGMIIDIDHMSQRTANDTLTLAESIPGGGYPLVSGHNGFRGEAGNENSRTAEQYRRIARLRGMAGVGSEAAEAYGFLRSYAEAGLFTNGRVAIGTDLNGLVRAPRPRPGSAVRYDASFPQSRTGSRRWDYNTDGVAHYGMLADFIRDMRTAPGANDVVDPYFYNAAEVFSDMWLTAERQKTRVR